MRARRAAWLLAACRLPRSAEARVDAWGSLRRTRPLLSDLHDSGNVEVSLASNDLTSTDLTEFVSRRRRGRPLILRRLLGPLGRRRNIQPLEPRPGKKGRMYAVCFGIVFVWISLATLFYSRFYDWPLPQSFFYAVDAGMSIGFCTDVAETRVASRAFTIVHILLGASCVGGALVLMVQGALEGVAHRGAVLYGRILEGDSMRKAFMSGVSKPAAVPSGLMEWASRKERGVLSYDEFRAVLKNNGLELTDGQFQQVCNFYDPEVEGCVRYDRFVHNFEGLHRILPQARSARYTSPAMRTISGAWDVVASLFTNESYRIYLIFVLWVAMGIAWGIVEEGWDPVTATHFAVSALATGGLTAPPVDANGILPARSALFCGFYCLLGIPLMALTLGIFANTMVEGYVVEEELAAISRPLSPSERDFASRSLCSKDAAIHLSDYVVLQLMRQGKLSVESFEFMKRQYQTLDERPFWLRSVGPD
ncbi:hypothetical protein ACHAXT_006519 [Thalassiosira profunda]